MKVLLDEGVPLGLRQILAQHQVKVLQDLGWNGIRTIKLLASAESAAFGVILTTDINMSQRAQTGLRLAIVRLPTNNLRALLGMAPQILLALERAEPGNVYELSSTK